MVSRKVACATILKRYRMMDMCSAEQQAASPQYLDLRSRLDDQHQYCHRHEHELEAHIVLLQEQLANERAA